MSVYESSPFHLEQDLKRFAPGDVMIMASVIGKMDTLSDEQRTEIESTELYHVMAPYIGSTALMVETSGLKPRLQLVVEPH